MFPAGFVLEGTAPWELPEALLGTLRLNYLDLKFAKKVCAWNCGCELGIVAAWPCFRLVPLFWLCWCVGAEMKACLCWWAADITPAPLPTSRFTRHVLFSHFCTPRVSHMHRST